VRYSEHYHTHAVFVSSDTPGGWRLQQNDQFPKVVTENCTVCYDTVHTGLLLSTHSLNTYERHCELHTLLQIRPATSQSSLPPALSLTSGVPREGVCGVQTPPEIPKALQNRDKLNPIVKTVAEFRKPTPQDVQKKGSKILKLPPVGSQLFYISNNK